MNTLLGLIYIVFGLLVISIGNLGRINGKDSTKYYIFVQSLAAGILLVLLGISYLFGEV